MSKDIHKQIISLIDQLNFFCNNHPDSDDRYGFSQWETPKGEEDWYYTIILPAPDPIGEKYGTGADCVLFLQKELDKKVDAFAASLSDELLKKIGAAIYTEETKRIEKRLDAGQFEPLNEGEKNLIRNGERVFAIKAYKARMWEEKKEVSLREAREVVEFFAQEIEGTRAEINAGTR